MGDTGAALLRTLAVLEGGRAEGLHLGAQLYVSRRGRVVAYLAVGEARRGVAMTPETLLIWFSAGKPVGAVALAQLWEAGRLDLDDPVTTFIPEFGAGGKGRVTIRHLLTHTGGFLRGWESSAYNTLPWDEIIARVCAAPLEPGWMPGRRAGYHAVSSWFVIGEVVRRVDGRHYRDYVREAIFAPLGMGDSWVGMPPERHAAYGDRIGTMHEIGADGGAQPYRNMDSAAGCARCVPGGNARGPIRELGRLYELLLRRGEHDGARLLTPQTVEALTTPSRVGLFDETFGRAKDWGLGFALDTARSRDGDDAALSFGPHASPRAFGHGGYRSSLGFADPEHGLVAAFVVNGTPPDDVHARRARAITTAIYEDLGLAGG